MNNPPIEKEKQQPLISIVVITYNSSKYVEETLDSLKNQEYPNMELIITDDASQDNTIDLCKQWLNKNKDVFIKSKIITTPINTGIPANCNRGVQEAIGEWVKIIAGDDIFLPHAISTFAAMVETKFEKPKIIQTNSKAYIDTFKDENYLYDWKIENNLAFFDLDAQQQYKLLKYHYFLNTPAIFIHHSIFRKYKFFEEFRRLEDYPFFIYCTSKGIKIDYLNLDTVGYRVHKDSVQNVNDKPYFSKESLNLNRKVLKKLYPNKRFDYPMILNHLYLFLDKYGFNNRSIISKVIYKILQIINSYVIKFKVIKSNK